MNSVLGVRPSLFVCNLKLALTIVKVGRIQLRRYASHCSSSFQTLIVLLSVGDMWKFHRGMTRPYFSRDKISHFDIFDQHADTVISIMKQRIAGGYSVDFQVSSPQSALCISPDFLPVLKMHAFLQDLIGRFTMDSATEFLFGSCVHSLKANIPYAHNVAFPPPPQSNSDQAAETANRFIEAFSKSMFYIAEREHLGIVWPLYEMFCDKTKAPMKIVSAYLDPIISAAVEKKRAAEMLKLKTARLEGEVEAETLLDELLRSTSGEYTYVCDGLLGV